jgi:RNA polymerase sigma factor (sigma-70 family)
MGAGRTGRVTRGDGGAVSRPLGAGSPRGVPDRPGRRRGRGHRAGGVRRRDRALHRFDRRLPFGPWLHRIVVNRAIDWSRARTLRREVSEAHDGEAPSERPATWSSELVAALAALDPDQRAAVVLRHLLEYTPGEIAELLESPRGTVNSRLRRALDRLADELGSGEGWP